MLRLISHTRIDVQTFTWSIPSRLTQAELVWRLNQCIDLATLSIQWIPESDGYYIHVDYVPREAAITASFNSDFSRTDRYVTTTVVTGFILLVIHAQAVTSVLAFRINHQFVVLPSTHPFPYTFQPLNKAAHL